MAVEVVVVVSVVEVNANSTSASVLSLYIAVVPILLLGRWIPRADVDILLMIPAFGEILGSADSADGAGPPLSSTHYALQRWCGARGEKRSAVFGSPAQLASPIRLGL